VAIIVIVLALNAGHYLRNYALWGNPLTTDNARLENDYINIKVLISNLSRNFILQTWIPIKSVNMMQYQAINLLHNFLDIDINDSGTTFSKFEPPPHWVYYFTEDHAGNVLHFILIILAIPAVILRSKKLRSYTLTFYLLALTAGYVLFSLLFKWNIWGNRLQLSLLVLASPLVAIAMPLANRKWLLNVIVVVLLLCSSPWLFKNRGRPLYGEWTIFTVDREKLYFVYHAEIGPSYHEAINGLKNMGQQCTFIGLIGSYSAFEYPIWALISKHIEPMPRLEYINVGNISGSIPLHDFKPCATLTLPD
jgi:hypothetical protein